MKVAIEGVLERNTISLKTESVQKDYCEFLIFVNSNIKLEFLI